MSWGPGWDFLDAQWRAQYPHERDPIEYGPRDPRRAYQACKQVIAWPADGHWHLGTYGLTELFEKRSAIAGQDGFGIELTLRVPRRANEVPPPWAVELLELLVEYVVGTRRSLGVGDHMALPESFDPASSLRGATLVHDPSFEAVTGPFGRLRFRQVVGLTADELDATAAVDDARVVKALAVIDPWLVTDPRRASVFDGPHAPPRPAAAPPLALTGPVALVEHLAIVRVAGGHECRLSSGDAATLADQLAVRLPAGRTFDVVRDDRVVRFAPGAACALSVGDEAVVTLTPSAVDALCAALRRGGSDVFAVAGVPGLTFRLVG